MSCLSFASARARLGGVICSEKTSEPIWLLARRTFKLRESNPGTGYRVPDELLELGVLCLGLLQDRDVGVGVFPECEEILVGGFHLTLFRKGDLARGHNVEAG